VDLFGLKFKSAILAARMSGSRRLLSLTICLTNRCNINCLYCYGDYWYNKEKMFSVDDLKYMIDEAVAMGIQSLNFTGGEPLIYKNVGEVVSYAASYNIRLSMVTNGYLVPQKINELKGLNSIIISLDGGKEINDRNRGKGCFDKVMQAAESCEKAGIDITCFKMTLNKDSVKELDWMFDFVKTKNSKLEVQFCRAPLSDRQKLDHGDKMLDDDEVMYYIEYLLKKKREGAPLMYKEEVYQYIKKWEKKHPEKEKLLQDELLPDFNYIKCYAGIYTAFIHGDGSMYPCNQVIPDFKAKNVLKDGFKESWEHLTSNKCKACNVIFLNQQHLQHDLYIGSFKNRIKNIATSSKS